eukprot:gene10716-22376_t
MSDWCLVTLSPVYRVIISNDNSTFHVIENNTLRRISDLKILIALGLEDALVQNISNADIQLLKQGLPIPDLYIYENSKIVGKFGISIEKSSHFVMKNKNINIMHRCNVAITHWYDHLHVCSRMIEVVDYSWSRDKICCNVFGDKSSPKTCLKHPLNNNQFILGEDPRIWTYKNELYFLFNAINITLWPSRRMFMMSTNDINLTTSSSVYAINVENAPYRTQKNWMPFIYKNTQLFIYSVQPHQIIYTVPTDEPYTTPLRPGLTSQSNGFKDLIAKLASSTMMTDFYWCLGDIRGGTPALLIGDRYLTFFHSRKGNMATTKDTYFMGAYTFAAEPPFQILSITAEPIIAKGFYQESGSSTVVTVRCLHLKQHMRLKLSPDEIFRQLRFQIGILGMVSFQGGSAVYAHVSGPLLVAEAQL